MFAGNFFSNFLFTLSFAIAAVLSWQFAPPARKSTLLRSVALTWLKVITGMLVCTTLFGLFGSCIWGWPNKQVAFGAAIATLGAFALSYYEVWKRFYTHFPAPPLEGEP